MGNIPSILASHSNDIEHEKIYQKITDAVEKKHLRIANLALTRVPRIITSEELKNELNEPMKSLDIHSNPLQHFPLLHLPNLVTLNLWGNNMALDMFAPFTNPHAKRGIQEKLKNRNRRSSNPKNQTILIENTEKLEDHIEKGAFSGFPKLDCLDLGCNQLTAVPLSIQKCSKLTQLTLSGNFLTISDVEALRSLKELGLLDLDLNNFSEIPPECWMDKVHLFSLTMRGNQITTIPGELRQLTALQTLNLADNIIQTVESSSFSGLSMLKKLYLFHNLISTLPADFFADLDCLTILMLQGNQLNHLPPLDGLKVLRVLNVSYNNLTRLPVMDALVSLTQLDVSHNRLLALPSSIDSVVELRSINASYNELFQLPRSMASLSHLSTLNLTGNCFTTGGRSITTKESAVGLQPIWSITSLQVLHLALNNINSLPLDAFYNLHNLTTLNLAFNDLTNSEIPLFVSSPKNEHHCHEKLDEDPYEKKEGCPESTHSTELKKEPEEEEEIYLVIEHLFLNGNRLESFPIEQILPLRNSLQTLALDGNKIPSIPAEIKKFSCLERFSISAPYLPESCKQRKKKNSLSCKHLVDLPLKRFYVGSYFEGSMEDIGFESGFGLTGLQYTDICEFPGFPAFSCSLDKIGALKERPYGSALCTGTSHDLEDCIHFRTLSLPSCGSKCVDYVALFDGHGGPEVALFIQQHLAPVIESYLRQSIEKDGLFFTDTPDNSNLVGKAIIRAYIETNNALEQWLQSSNLYDKNVGSTCITLLVTDNMLYCANVGDSRAVLGTFSLPSVDKRTRSSSQSLPHVTNCNFLKGQHTLFSTRLSFDHKPNVRAERIRIRKNGGVLLQSLSGSCSYRLTQPCGGPTLAVSRSFGDFHLRPSMSVEPDVFCRPLEDMDQFFVVASDGLWDVLSDKMCIDIVAELLYHLNVECSVPLKKACEIAASNVRDLVFSLGSNDDLSVVIVPLFWNKGNCMESYYHVQSSPPPEAAEFPKQPKKKKRKKRV